MMNRITKIFFVLFISYTFLFCNYFVISVKAIPNLSGRILLQVEDKGQAWYINPDNNKRYYLGRPADAFNVMRTLGLGISNNDFNNIENNPPSRLYGKILLKVEDNGRAYYVDPVSHSLYYLGRPADAFNVMRTLGLGITDSDLGQININ